MANFKTHIKWGVFIGVVLVVAALLYSFFSSFEAALWLLVAVVIGSFLPDLDLDEGIPFQMLFGLLGAGVAGALFFHLQQGGGYGLKSTVVFSVLAFAAIRFGIGNVFKKFTHHRGFCIRFRPRQFSGWRQCGCWTYSPWPEASKFS